MLRDRKSTCRCGWPVFLSIAAVAVGAVALTGDLWQSTAVAIAVAAAMCAGTRLGLAFWPFKRRPACYAIVSGECASPKSVRTDMPSKAEVARSWAVMF